VETQQSPGGSSVDEDDRSVVRSLQDDSAIDSDSEDVGNESYEVCSDDSDDILTMCVSEEQRILYIFSFHHIDTLNGYIYMYYLCEIINYVSVPNADFGDSPEKFDPSHYTFQRHSR